MNISTTMIAKQKLQEDENINKIKRSPLLSGRFDREKLKDSFVTTPLLKDVDTVIGMERLIDSKFNDRFPLFKVIFSVDSSHLISLLTHIYSWFDSDRFGCVSNRLLVVRISTEIGNGHNQ